jgi:NAD(P)H-flavin reductase
MTMTEDLSHGPSWHAAHLRSTTTSDLTTLEGAFAAVEERTSSLSDRIAARYHAMAPAPGRVDQPVSADGTVAPPHLPDGRWIYKAVLYTAGGLVVDGRDARDFDDERTAFLADLGRDLRKDGLTVGHIAAAGQAVSRALCAEFDQPWPGPDITYQRAENLGIPAGLTELLQVVDFGVRVVAIGSAEDDEAGIPATVGAEVTDVQRRAPHITVVRLDGGRRAGGKTGWPGQFLEVRTPADPDRWQLLATALPPNPDGLLEFHLHHPVDEPLRVHTGETWVLANPTGALDLPADESRGVVMLAIGSGLAALRCLLLDISSRPSHPQVHLYWEAEHRDDLHELVGVLSLAGAFDWLTVTPVVSGGPGDPSGQARTAWHGTQDATRFYSYAHPAEDILAMGEPFRSGTAAATAVADGTWRNRRVLIAGDDSAAGRAAVKDAVHVLTAAGADPDAITAEP